MWRHRSLPAGLARWLVMATALAPLTGTPPVVWAGSHPAGAPDPGRSTLWGNVELLPAADRRVVERALDDASRQIGSAVAIRLVARLSHERLPALAEETFTARQMAERGTDAILLVVALHDRRAVIETGKGPAGLVPEVDARAIVGRLTRELSASSLGPRLAMACRDIVASARATRLRRQPLPPDEPAADPAASAAGNAAVKGVAPAATGTASAPADGPQVGEPPPAPRRGSRLPLAIAASALFLVSLGLYKRRQMSSLRRRQPPPSAPLPRAGVDRGPPPP